MVKKWISLADPEGHFLFKIQSTLFLVYQKYPLPPNDLMKIVRDFGSELEKNTLS